MSIKLIFSTCKTDTSILSTCPENMSMKSIFLDIFPRCVDHSNTRAEGSWPPSTPHHQRRGQPSQRGDDAKRHDAAGGGRFVRRQAGDRHREVRGVGYDGDGVRVAGDARVGPDGHARAVGPIPAKARATLTLAGKPLMASQRLLARGIDAGVVAGIVRNGEIIENYPTDFPYPSCLLLGVAGATPIHVVAARDPSTSRPQMFAD